MTTELLPVPHAEPGELPPLPPEVAEEAHVENRRRARTARRVSLRRRSISALAAIVVLVFGYDVWTTFQNHEQGRTIERLSQTSVNLSRENLVSQNNHHAATDKKNAQILSLSQQEITLTKEVVTLTAQVAAVQAQRTDELNQQAATQQVVANVVGQIPAIGAALAAGQDALLAKLAAEDSALASVVSKVSGICSTLPPSTPGC